MADKDELINRPTDPSDKTTPIVRGSQDRMSDSTQDDAQRRNFSSQPGGEIHLEPPARGQASIDQPAGTPDITGKPEEQSSTRGGLQSETPTSPLPVNDMQRSWFEHDEKDDLQARWTTIQVQFVDDPCSAVEQGEAMVAETIERVKQIIADRQQELAGQWLNHDDITTEELRITLQNYRSMLKRLIQL